MYAVVVCLCNLFITLVCKFAYLQDDSTHCFKLTGAVGDTHEITEEL